MKFIIFLMVPFSFISTPVSAQKDEKPRGEKQHSISFIFGVSALGSGPGIKKGMKESGLGDFSSSFFSQGPNAHPTSEPPFHVGLETRHALQEGRHLSFGAGITLQQVTGYDLIGNGNFLTVKTRWYTLKGAKAWPVGTTVGRYHLGLLVGMFRISDKYRYDPDAPHTIQNRFLPGVCAGYDLPLAKSGSTAPRRRLALRVNLDIVPSAKVGPFAEEHTAGNESFVSTFQEKSVNPSAVTLALRYRIL